MRNARSDNCGLPKGNSRECPREASVGGGISVAPFSRFMSHKQTLSQLLECPEFEEHLTEQITATRIGSAVDASELGWPEAIVLECRIAGLTIEDLDENFGEAWVSVKGSFEEEISSITPAGGSTTASRTGRFAGTINITPEFELPEEDGGEEESGACGTLEDLLFDSSELEWRVGK